MSTEILICVLCRPADLPREHPRPGRALLEAVENMALRDGLSFPIRAVECMSGCNRHCTVSLQAHEKCTYMFGDLAADEISAEQILVCAQLHQNSADGLINRNLRPERLRQGILARIPSISLKPIG